MRYRLALLGPPMVPATVVKSSAPIITGRPPMRPEPATIASAGTSPGQRAQLTERAGVEQVVDTGTSVELARGTVLGQPFLAAHRACGAPARREIAQRVVPARRRPPASVVTSEDRTATT